MRIGGMANFHEIEAARRLFRLGQAASLKEIKSTWDFVSLSCPIATFSPMRWLQSSTYSKRNKDQKGIEY
jgi:hypothetical protein